MLQCVSVCCSVLQCGTTYSRITTQSVHQQQQQHAHLQFRDTLQHTATHCNTLQHTGTHCNTQPQYAQPQYQDPNAQVRLCVSQCVAVRCSVWQCVAVCCSVFHCVAAVLRFHCLGRCVCVLLYGHVRLGMGVGGAECVLQGAAVCRSGAVLCSVVQCGAVWCSVVQCGAVWCSVVMCSAVCWCAMARV